MNFIQKPLPPGSRTGAGFLKKPGSGALDMGQRASTGLTMCTLDLSGAPNVANVLQSTSFGPTLPLLVVPGWPMSTLDVILRSNTPISSLSSVTSCLYSRLFPRSSPSPILRLPSSRSVSSLWALELAASSRTSRLSLQNNTRTKKHTFASGRTVTRRLLILQPPQLVSTSTSTS